MKYKAFGFDIDGTLYPNHFMYWLSMPTFLKHPVLVSHYGKIRKQIRKLDYTGDFRTVQAELLAKSMNISVEKALLKLENDLYSSWDHTFRRIKPYRYVKQFILNLRNKGYRTAALSDFPIGKKLQYLGMADLFDVVFSSEDSGYLKPSPVPFQLMAEKLGYSINEILYVGNSHRYDIIGGKNAGLLTAYLGKGGKDISADYIFTNYKDLENQLFPKS